MNLLFLRSFLLGSRKIKGKLFTIYCSTWHPMSVTSIREDKRLIPGEMDDTAQPVYHPARGEGKEEKQGGWSNAPDKGGWVSRANSHPFPGHTKEAIVTDSAFASTGDVISVWLISTARTMQSIWPRGAWRSNMPGQPLLGRGLQWISITHGVSAPLSGWPPLLPATLGSLCQNGGAWDVLDHLSCPWLILRGQGLAFRLPSSKLTERQVAGRFCCFGFSGSWAAGEVLEAEFPGDWAPHRSLGTGKHLYSLTRLLLAGGNPVASWEGKIASKMGFVLQARGTEPRSRGMGPLRRILESLSHVLMPQGKWYTLGTSAD